MKYKFNTRRKTKCDRFINWITDLIDDYLNAFIEKPIRDIIENNIMDI
ncbi:MAG: hypothetical protein V8S21_12285 [Lachnospira eligens]